MYVSILGRQPALGIAELEGVFGGANVTPLSSLAATIDTPRLDIQTLGGSRKAGKVVTQLTSSDWTQVNQKVIQYYTQTWGSFEGKITLGLSAYGFDVTSRQVQKIGITLKQRLKKAGTSLRLIPNAEPALSTATSHHNKLGLSSNKIELLIIRSSSGRIVVAESTGAQNITAYAKRDQQRPKRDAFVGMLPPKLAQIMINLVGKLEVDPSSDLAQPRILDPFCGTGVILQEASLMRYGAYGTDIAEKMIRYSRDNLNWLQEQSHIHGHWYLHEGDAMTTKWQQPIAAIVSETYLGQAFSAPPSPAKLDEVRKNCNHIITEFLKNLRTQIKPGTPVCIAIPAWRASDGSFTHLPFITTIAQLGYKPHEFHNVSQNDLLYYREDQIVARELLVLTKI